jgi:hypothetical protein
MTKKITIFGSCRLNSLSKYNNKIRDNISYTYDTKEILEVIKFIKHNHLTPEQTITTFRTPMITKTPIYYKDLNGVIDNTYIFVIEICGKKSYKYNNICVHSALAQFSNDLIKSQITINQQSDEEIEEDIIQIIKQLNTKNIIIVSHITTDNISERYKLSKLLESLCLKHNIYFINPVKEIEKKGYNIYDLVIHETKIKHYNENGNKIINEIYEEFINKVISNLEV